MVPKSAGGAANRKSPPPENAFGRRLEKAVSKTFRKGEQELVREWLTIKRHRSQFSIRRSVIRENSRSLSVTIV